MARNGYFSEMESKKRAIEQPFPHIVIYPFNFNRFLIYEHGNSVYYHGKPLYYHENSLSVSVIIQAVSVFGMRVLPASIDFCLIVSEFP